MIRLLAAFLLTAVSLFAQPSKVSAVNARTTYHNDGSGTYTTSVQNPEKHTQEEETFSAQKVRIARKVYLLNERNEPVQGNIFDGKDRLVARVLFRFDAFGRRIQQRFMNLQGQVYQDIFFDYDTKGVALLPRSQTYNVAAPDIRPGVIDFTQPENAPRPLDRSQGEPSTAQNSQPFTGNVERLPGSAPTTGTTTQPTGPATNDAKKPNLWQRLLGKKKE
jgi:hypothetical protein